MYYLCCGFEFLGGKVELGEILEEVVVWEVYEEIGGIVFDLIYLG